MHFFIMSFAPTRTRSGSRVLVGVQRVSTLKLSKSNHTHALHYRGTYDTSKLQDALESFFLSDSPSSRFSISTSYHIPKSTFNDWCDKLKTIINQCNTNDVKKQAIHHAIQSTHAGPPRLLDTTTEDQLVNWAFRMQQLGYPVSKLTLCMKAMELHMYTQQQQQHPDDARPHHTRASQNWWIGFKARHPEIVLRTPHALE